MKKLVFLLMLVMITSCKFFEKNHQVSRKSDTTADLDEKLFFSKALQDSLINFIESIDTIPNPWNIAPEFMVQFEQDSNRDTILLISCAIDFIPASKMKGYSAYLDKEIEVIGGLMIGNKPIMVRKQKGIAVDKIINTVLVDKSVGDQIDSIRQLVKKEHNYQWDAPMIRTYKEYIISSTDSIVLKRSFHLGIKTYERLNATE